MTAEGITNTADNGWAQPGMTSPYQNIGAEQLATWRAHFTRQLLDLLLDKAVIDELMKAMDEKPELFCDAKGRPVRFDTWRTAVLDGRWTIDGGYREEERAAMQRLGSLMEAVNRQCRSRLI